MSFGKFEVGQFCWVFQNNEKLLARIIEKKPETKYSPPTSRVEIYESISEYLGDATPVNGWVGENFKLYEELTQEEHEEVYEYHLCSSPTEEDSEEITLFGFKVGDKVNYEQKHRIRFGEVIDIDLSEELLFVQYDSMYDNKTNRFRVFPAGDYVCEYEEEEIDSLKKENQIIEEDKLEETSKKLIDKLLIDLALDKKNEELFNKITKKEVE